MAEDAAQAAQAAASAQSSLSGKAGKAKGSAGGLFAQLFQAALAGLAGGQAGQSGQGDTNAQGEGASAGTSGFARLAAQLTEKAAQTQDLGKLQQWVKKNVDGQLGTDLAKFLDKLGKHGEPQKVAAKLLGSLDRAMQSGKLSAPSREGLLKAAEHSDPAKQREALLEHGPPPEGENDQRDGARALVALLTLVAAREAGPKPPEDSQDKAQREAQQPPKAEDEPEEAPERAVRTGAGAFAVTQILNQEGSRTGTARSGLNQPRGSGEAAGKPGAEAGQGGQRATSFMANLVAAATGSSGSAVGNGSGAGQHGNLNPFQVQVYLQAQQQGGSNAGQQGQAAGGGSSAHGGLSGQGGAPASPAGHLVGLGGTSQVAASPAPGKAADGAAGARMAVPTQAAADGTGKGSEPIKLTEAQKAELVRQLNARAAGQGGQAGSSAGAASTPSYGGETGQAKAAGSQAPSGQSGHLLGQQSGKAELPPALKFALGQDQPSGEIKLARSPVGTERASAPQLGAHLYDGSGAEERKRYGGASTNGNGQASGGRQTAAMASLFAQGSGSGGSSAWPSGGFDASAWSSGTGGGGTGGSSGQTLSQLLQHGVPEALRASAPNQAHAGRGGRSALSQSTSTLAAAAAGEAADGSTPGTSSPASGSEAGGDGSQSRSNAPGYFAQPSRPAMPATGSGNAGWQQALAQSGHSIGRPESEAAENRQRQAPPRGPARQVSGAIGKAVGNGQSSFTMRLQPPELGRVDVKLDLGSDGSVRARIAAERPDTLELLRQDSRALERSLQEAGLDADGSSLEFQLKDEGGRQTGEDGDGDAQRGSADADGEAEANEDGEPAPGTWMDERGHVDVSL